MSRPQVVACLAVAGLEDLPEAVGEWLASVDLVEVRLDAVAGGAQEVAGLCSEVARWGRPLLLTPRSAGEGGFQQWKEAERRDALKAIWEHPAVAYVDIELRDSPDLLDWALAHCPPGCEVIASFHAFQGYPGAAFLDGLASEAAAKGTDHFKAAVHVADWEEVAELACWTRFRSRRQSLITMGLGEEGALSRLMNPAFGSWACYGAIGQATGPGQLGVEELAHWIDRLYP